MSLAGYRIGAAIGQGAVARVVAVHAPDGRALAGKILHESHRDDPAAAARFSQEAAILSGLRHPNLVAVEGIMPIDGTPVLLMELVDGPDLAHVIAREAPLDEVRLRGVLRGIAAGLGAAHAAGVVHRDLKPSNVLMASDGTPKIADFGMARASSLAGIDRNAFAVLGTPDYMAPESIDPLAVDARTDLYALGCIAFEAATGRPRSDWRSRASATARASARSSSGRRRSRGACRRGIARRRKSSRAPSTVRS